MADSDRMLIVYISGMFIPTSETTAKDWYTLVFPNLSQASAEQLRQEIKLDHRFLKKMKQMSVQNYLKMEETLMTDYVLYAFSKEYNRYLVNRKFILEQDGLSLQDLNLDSESDSNSDSESDSDSSDPDENNFLDNVLNSARDTEDGWIMFKDSRVHIVATSIVRMDGYGSIKQYLQTGKIDTATWIPSTSSCVTTIQLDMKLHPISATRIERDITGFLRLAALTMTDLTKFSFHFKWIDWGIDLGPIFRDHIGVVAQQIVESLGPDDWKTESDLIRRQNLDSSTTTFMFVSSDIRLHRSLASNFLIDALRSYEITMKIVGTPVLQLHI